MNSKEFKQKAIRHGEVFLKPIDRLPKNVNEIFQGKEYIVGHSETGHHHVAVGDLTVFGLGERFFLRVNNESKLEHRKTFEFHETKTIFKGLYEITLKRAYNYFAKVMEKVRD